MVDYSTSNRTAQAGLDYGTVSGTLSFGPGVMSQAFGIPITSGCASNGSKIVTLLLKKHGGHSARKATLTIVGE
jgi:hypothetical protein